MNFETPESVAEEWEVGDVILNRYEVRQKFEGGGMGLVYRVYHREWDIEMAVKSPRSNFFQTTEQVENFEREAETWVNLGLHPHIVSCYYVRRLGRIPWIFAEYIEAGTLDDWIRTRRLYEGTETEAWERVLDVAVQVAWGLHYAHEKELVHQDVKPGNVLMMPDGTAKVSDFGLASARKCTAQTRSPGRQQGQSMLVQGSGYLTKEYASPEQFSGIPLTRRSDIWSWAVMVLEMIKGACDWADGRAAPHVLLEYYGDCVGEDPLGQILQKCLEMAAQDRPSSMEVVAAELVRLYESMTGKAFPRKFQSPQSLALAAKNNRAVALVELNQIWGQGGAFAAFSELRKACLFDKTIQTNVAIFDWRYAKNSIKQLNETLDRVRELPGPRFDTQWHYDIEMLKCDHHRAHICAQFAQPELAILAKREDLRIQQTLAQFFISDERRKEAWRQRTSFSWLSKILDPHISADKFLSCSSFPSVRVCKFTRVNDQPGTELTTWDLETGAMIHRFPVSHQRRAIAALSENGVCLGIMTLPPWSDGPISIHDSKAVEQFVEFSILRLDSQQPILKYKLSGVATSFIKEQSVAALRLAVAEDCRSICLLSPGQGGHCHCVFISADATGEIKCKFDLKDITNIKCADIIKLSSDGTILFVSDGSNAQLWTIESGWLGRCILDLWFDRYELGGHDDELPGFSIPNRFTFKICEWNGYTVLQLLRNFARNDVPPLRPLRPLGGLEAEAARSEQQHLLESAAEASGRGDYLHAVMHYNDALASPVAIVQEILEQRWNALLYLDRIPTFGWQCDTVFYYDSYVPLFSVEQGLRGQFRFRRCQGRHEIRGPVNYPLSHDRPSPFMFTRDERTIIGLGPINDLHWAVIIVHGYEQNAPATFQVLSHPDAHSRCDPSPLWQASIANRIQRSTSSRPDSGIVMISDKVILCAKPNKIEVRFLSTGELCAEESFLEDLGQIWECKNSQGETTSAIVSVPREAAIYQIDSACKISHRIVHPIIQSATWIQAMSSGGYACVLTQEKLHRSYYFWHSRLQEPLMLWSRQHGFPEWALTVRLDSALKSLNGSILGNVFEPHGWAVSQCGNIVAFIIHDWVLVIDPERRHLVTSCQVPGTQTLCFDASGRWLAAAGTAQTWELFELFWVPKEQESIVNHRSATDKQPSIV